MIKTGPITFLKQVRAELGKVTWPSRQETVASTLAVFIMVTAASLFMYFADQIISFAIRTIMSIGL